MAGAGARPSFPVWHLTPWGAATWHLPRLQVGPLPSHTPLFFAAMKLLDLPSDVLDLIAACPALTVRDM